jgi:predicted transcriptional regulator
VPAVLAKHLKLPEAELRAGLDALASAGRVATLSVPGRKGLCYLWTDG